MHGLAKLGGADTTEIHSGAVRGAARAVDTGDHRQHALAAVVLAAGQHPHDGYSPVAVTSTGSPRRSRPAREVGERGPRSSESITAAFITHASRRGHQAESTEPDPPNFFNPTPGDTGPGGQRHPLTVVSPTDLGGSAHARRPLAGPASATRTCKPVLNGPIRRSYDHYSPQRRGYAMCR